MSVEAEDFVAGLFGLTGRTAVVTGAASGLGRRAALVLAAAGAKVVICATDPAGLEETAALVAAEGGSAEPRLLDVRDAEAVAGLFASLDRVDVVVSAAGRDAPESATALDPETWRAVVDTELTGAFLVARAAAARMIELSTRGRIVQLASAFATVGRHGHAAEDAARAGVVQLVRSLAYELADRGITVTGLLPGVLGAVPDLETPEWRAQLAEQVPGGQPGALEDLDTTVLFLASPANSYVTGTTVTVDGGLTAGIPL